MIIRGNTITVQKPSLALKGGTMGGTLDMNKNILKGIPTPTEKDHAVNKEYADFINKKAEEANTAAANALKDAKEYSDEKHLEQSAVLTAAGWTGDTAPYTQTVAVEGILATDEPHYAVVYSGELDNKLNQKEAFSLIDDLETADGSITFTCLEEKPEIDLTIQMEVNR